MATPPLQETLLKICGNIQKYASQQIIIYDVMKAMVLHLEKAPEQVIIPGSEIVTNSDCSIVQPGKQKDLQNKL